MTLGKPADLRRQLLGRSGARLDELAQTYRGAKEIGLVLGAGVSVASHVPDYNALALDFLQAVLKARRRGACTPAAANRCARGPGTGSAAPAPG